MIRLSRVVRFALVDNGNSCITNSWSGWPATNRIVPQLALTCTVAGQPDPQTGYVCNIRLLDNLIREVITGHIIPEFDGPQTAENLLCTVWRLCQSRWTSEPEIIGLELAVSPFQKYWIQSENEAMICLTQQFEFSAAHRLHCNELSDEENRKLFGKCNNPEGHGHNYVVEVSVDRESTGDKPVVDLGKFETIVKKRVVDRLDHKHLNRDVEYFSDVNPSVENIAIAIWNWLEGHLEPAHLAHIRVYETPKTWADYRR